MLSKYDINFPDFMLTFSYCLSFLFFSFYYFRFFFIYTIIQVSKLVVMAKISTKGSGPNGLSYFIRDPTRIEGSLVRAY